MRTRKFKLSPAMVVTGMILIPLVYRLFYVFLGEDWGPYLALSAGIAEVAGLFYCFLVMDS